MTQSTAVQRAVAKYDKENIKGFYIKLHKEKDKDIIDKLESVEITIDEATVSKFNKEWKNVTLNRVKFSSSTSNLIEAPIDFPIQFLCISLVESGKSTSSSPWSNLSAYAGIFNTHCFRFFLITG